MTPCIIFLFAIAPSSALEYPVVLRNVAAVASFSSPAACDDRGRKLAAQLKAQAPAGYRVVHECRPMTKELT